MFRNVNTKYFTGSNWNFVHVGNINASESHCGDEAVSGSLQNIQNVEKTPIIVEKPYIIHDGFAFKLMIPNLETDKVGTTANFSNAKSVSFN